MKSLAVHVLALASILTAAVVGCSDPARGTASNSADVTGMVSSASFAPKSAVARYVAVKTTTDGGAPASMRALTFILSDKPNTCSVFHAQESQNLTFTIFEGDVGGGTYPIVDARAVSPKLGEAQVSVGVLSADA